MVMLVALMVIANILSLLLGVPTVSLPPPSSNLRSWPGCWGPGPGNWYGGVWVTGMVVSRKPICWGLDIWGSVSRLVLVPVSALAFARVSTSSQESLCSFAFAAASVNIVTACA